MIQQNAQAGPSRHHSASIQPSQIMNDDETSPTASTSLPSTAPGINGDDEGSDEDEERIDVSYIQSFASKIQHLPTGPDVDGTSQRVKIIVPKRGEKDFEPLQDTVNLQDMMLQRSREALFNALVGVRGGNIKSMSQAILSPTSPYPRVLILRGHLFDHMGVSVRHRSGSTRDRSPAHLALFPEEALYLLERGSLQIWVGPEAETNQEKLSGLGEWSDEEHGVKGAVEMSVQEGFARFIGSDGLSWERYQAYAYLRRLGYTVYRTRQFIPRYFTGDSVTSAISSRGKEAEPFRTWWLSLPGWMAALLRFMGRSLQRVTRAVHRVGLGIATRQQQPLSGSLLRSWSGGTYGSLFSALRRVPAGHSVPLPSQDRDAAKSDLYDPLVHNPYLPFFHVWKPNTPWNKTRWDRGSEAGLKSQPPDYVVAVVNSRTVPMPTIHQLDTVFQSLADEPKGRAARRGPQYERKPNPLAKAHAQQPKSWLDRISNALGIKHDVPTHHLSIGSVLGQLRSGDRALIVAVNDSGNTGWVRFGRSGFADAIIL